MLNPIHLWRLSRPPESLRLHSTAIIFHYGILLCSLFNHRQFFQSSFLSPSPQRGPVLFEQLQISLFGSIRCLHLGFLHKAGSALILRNEQSFTVDRRFPLPLLFSIEARIFILQ
eukprot:Gb_02563 [translate_table: standard]